MADANRHLKSANGLTVIGIFLSFMGIAVAGRGVVLSLSNDGETDADRVVGGSIEMIIGLGHVTAIRQTATKRLEPEPPFPLNR
jgi:hypothetical protein